MALAFLVHMAVSTFAAMALAMAAGRMGPLIAIISLELGAAAGIWTWRSFRNDPGPLKGINPAAAAMYAFILFVGIEHFLFLLKYDRHGLKTLHLNNFGDLTMHIQYIRYLAGANFWPENPGFTGTLLRYPLGMDLYNALWEAVGVQLDSHLFLAGAILTAVAVIMLHRWMGWFGVGAFFFNGGLSNWKIFSEGRLFDFQNEAAWKSFFLSLWITQRGFLFAVPAGIYISNLVLGVLLEERSLRKEEKIVCAALWTALAWFHLHTFFILTLTLGICVVLYKKSREMLGILVPVMIAGFIFGLISTSGFSQFKVFRIQWDWVAGNENFISFWTKNLGPWLLLAGWTIYLSAKSSNSRFRPMAAVFFGLFIVFTFVIVAPWDWDNIKVLLWLYLLIAWLSWKMWISRLPQIPAVLLACVLFVPGALSLVSSLPWKNEGAQLYQAADLSEAKAALMDIDKDAVLAINPGPNHPAMFWGVKVAEGYPGHMWSHGIDSSERERKIDMIFRGEDWLFTAKSIGVTHIYWGDSEKAKYGAINPSWQNVLKDVSRSKKVQVYDVLSFLP